MRRLKTEIIRRHIFFECFARVSLNVFVARVAFFVVFGLAMAAPIVSRLDWRRLQK